MVSVRLFDSALPSPSLPFVLGDDVVESSANTSFVLGTAALQAPADDARFDAILDRLDSLQAIAAQSQSDLDMLRRMNSELLELVRRTQPEEPALVSAAEPAVFEATSTVEAVLALRLLGSFDVQMRGQSIGKWPSRKARLVLAYLVIERGRMVAKDVLIDLFWPDAPPERGSNNLSIAVHQLRTALSAIDAEAGQCIIVRQGLYGVDAAKVRVDVWDFQNRLAEARRALERRDDATARLALAAATDICQGDLLESDPYEEWAGGPRRTLGVAFTQSLAWLAEDASKHSDWPRVLDFAARILQRDRCDEAAHRWLMTAHWKLGNRPQALQQYRLYEEALAEELGVQPSDDARLLRDQILSQP